ncbi:hypothetical protein TNCV_2583811 [Trichonephila clavipes]|nr:hypothetical protein TNCV_2583811 [Trichonephila clavipes]
MLNSCVMHRHTGPAPGITVWGDIGYHSHTPLVRIVSTVNSQRYISEVLEPVVLPYLQGLATAIFQQDNARPHVARIVQRFFVNHHIELLPWPARSPDLSPIENMWFMVSQRLTQITPAATTPDQLSQRGEAAWSAVPQKHIQSLFEAMPRRVAAGGNVLCNVINCPLLTCQYPARANGECCRHCDDCEYLGNYVKNEEVFNPETCVECKCQKGNISCKKIDCLNPICDVPRRSHYEQCCSLCQKGCQYDGKDYEDGSVFKPSFNPCLNCSCEKGIVRCNPQKCPEPVERCEIPVFPPGGCCPYCPKCSYNGREYSNGHRWRISNQTCETCVCMNGIVSCLEKESCPGRKCTHGLIPAGECCSPCIDCKYNSYTVLNNMQFSPPDDPCARCVCQRGNITCVRETCPNLLCSVTEHPPGACCPVCKG